MKKIVSILLAALLLLSLAACGAKNPENEEGEPEEPVEEPVSEPEEEPGTEPEEEVTEPITGQGPEYWCELYGQNRCPFYISRSGTEEKYYFKNGGDLTFWVYTSDNTDGWYLYNDHIISADNQYAIDVSETAKEAFSSFCTYEAQPYTGKTLTPEQQKEHQNGVFYVLNPYTPISTNWGIKFFSDSSRGPDEELPESSVYGLTDTLKDQEWFDLYLIWNPAWYPEFDGDAVDLWAFEHRDKAEYPEQLTDELKEQAANLGCLDYEEESDLAHIRTFIPNQEADGLDAGRIDLVLTYAGDVVVGLVTVDVQKEGGNASDGSEEEAIVPDGPEEENTPEEPEEENVPEEPAEETVPDEPSEETVPAVTEKENVPADGSGEETESTAYHFKGYTETADWPGEDCWTSYGLPSLPMSEDVNGSVHISDKEWIYPLNGSDGILIEARPAESQIDTILSVLREAGIDLQEDPSFEKGYTAHYTNGSKEMKLTVSETGSGKLAVQIITDPTEN